MLSTDNRDLDYLLSGETTLATRENELLSTDQWREEGPWLALLLLPLAALAFRKGWVFAFACVFVVGLPSQPAAASVWEDLWYTPDQQGRRALDEGDADAAARSFEDPEWSAVASYRAGDYGRSAAMFADGDDTRSLYNLGNALARLGEFEPAVRVYEQVLELEPDHEDAAYNLELLKGLMEQQQQEQDSQQQSSEQNSGGESQSQESPEQQGMDAQSQSESQSDSGESSPREDGEMSDEELEALEQALEQAAREAEQNANGEPGQMSEEELAALREMQAEQQAMEQWLRRIPNDPGGLLRRKFRYQYQRSGKDQDGNNLWPDDEVQPW